MTTEWTQARNGTQLLWLPIPAYAAFPILLWVMHMRVWTFVVALSVCATLTIFKMRGRSVGWIIRRVHCWLRGEVVFARPVWFRRRMQHLNSFDLVELRPDRG
jgi:hypothetical protein